ncbi:MAG: hypothetical protein Fur0032_10070 [Terrimicrobiaceae bacterium]
METPVMTCPEFYVSPEGCDRDGGGRNSPLASVAEALRRARSGTILLAGATHRLSAPLRFGPESAGEWLVRPAGDEPVVLDAGVPITDWIEATHKGRRAWVADLPEVRAGTWSFRQLFVDGVRRPRARRPKFGTSADSRGNLFRMADIRRLEASNKMEGGDFLFQPAPGDVPDSPWLYDAEIVVPHFWLEERMTQPRLLPSGWVESARRSAFTLTAAFGPELACYYIDNFFDALEEPGEWFLDRHAGRLHYLPLPEEKIGATLVVAPRLRRIIEVHGSSYGETKQWGDPGMMARAGGGLRFEQLVLRHADWLQPNPSFSVQDKIPRPERPLAACGQSACDVEGAVSLHLAENVTFSECTIEHVGGYGMEIGEGCRRVEVVGCSLRDLGAGGIRLSGSERNGSPSLATGYSTFTDNTIEAGGRVFHAAVGILAMNTMENVIAHNHIHDLFYSGISVGWSWGYKDTISRDNLVLFNHVHDVGQGLLSDLGAIYILGVQPGTIVAGNHVHHVARRHYGSIGIYLDEGASHIVVERNLVHDIEGACANVHFGRENIFRHNRFLVAPNHVGITIGKSEGHLAATLLANTLTVPQGSAAFGGGYKGDPRKSFLSAANTFLTPDGLPPIIWDDGHGERPATWDSWLSSGQERGSIILAPADTSLPAQNASQAGLRPPDARPPLRQPLTREDRPAA